MSNLMDELTQNILTELPDNPVFREDRMHTLYEFLTTEKIPGRKWDFECVNAGFKVEGHPCKSLGCSIGEFPVIWKQWKQKYKMVTLDGCYAGEFKSVAYWFGISEEESRALFDYDGGICESYDIFPGFEDLPGSATRRQVAGNIRKFIIHKLTPKKGTQND